MMRHADDYFPQIPSIDGPLFAPPSANPFERSSIDPTDDERLLAGVIHEHQGRANPIPLAAITTQTGWSERMVKGIVEQLRVTHRMPIGAIREHGGGYFWIVDEEDRRIAVTPYRQQIISMWRTLRVLDETASLRELLGQLRLEDGQEPA